jgi:UDP-N-acetylmuramoyl-L-alanyl-D-glutamate--2,6-diaminopimelate ligase
MTGLAREGVTHVAYEASSHGLSQYRNEGLRVVAGAFTNLSRDHLDYHATMEDYFAAKMRLFDDVVADDGTAVIWADDDAWSGKAVAHAAARGLNLLTVGAKGEGIRLLSRTPTQLGQTLEIEHGAEASATRKVNLPLIGAYQAANALVAAGWCWPPAAMRTARSRRSAGSAGARAAGTRRDQPRRRAGLCRLRAHPDAIEAAIAALRPHVKGRLITVFGAGGDRDGASARKWAAPPAPAPTGHRHRRQSARRRPGGHPQGRAGRLHRRCARDRRSPRGHRRRHCRGDGDDIVLVAGKGHEQGQIVGRGDARILPFDDVQVARECAGPAGGT